MRTPALLVLAAALLSGCPKPTELRGDPPENQGEARVLLDGEVTPVKWSDGDTFRILGGPRKDKRARLSGFNTLEDYGPVHRWGSWTHGELYALSKRAGEFATTRRWTCTTKGDEDSYGRLLVECPDAALALIGEGLAMAYSVDGKAPSGALGAQREAQDAGRGMWAKGVPEAIVSSVHSADGDSAYNRLVDTRTGHARKVPHQDRYETCQEVCVEDSCLVYVPYEDRYGPRRASCLADR